MKIYLRSKARSTASSVSKYLQRNDMLRWIAKRNPTLVVSMKRLSKRALGESVASSSISTEDISADGILNPDLSINYLEHTALLNDNKVYWCEKEAEGTYKRHKNDPRVVAIYLPQFHPFDENDKAWGKGFTEWTNVTAATPWFVGQQQPVLPSDLGFYDLRLPVIMKQQIDLAKKYGIYGFQFYYYWFSGKKVMDLPINTVLQNSDWDFHFSICWANENWTRKWDGGDNEIIFEQKNNPDDPLNFIKDVAPVLNDKRYIQEKGRPILTVYRVELLDDPERYVEVWRDYFKREFKKDLWLIGHTYSKDTNPLDVGFDATMDFTPIGSLQPDLKPWVDDRKYLTEQFREEKKLLNLQWRGQVIDFRFIAKKEIANLHNNQNFYKTISPSWSNEARRKGNDGYTFYYSSPEIFAHWLDKICDYEINIQRKDSPIVFINAWNEWAEAAMLEPSQHMGHNSLKRIAETVSKYGKEKTNRDMFPAYGFQYSQDARLAIVIHLFYPDMWDRLSKKLQGITEPFDVYVSVPPQHTDFTIENISKYHKNTNIITVPNRGRDVLPFLTIMNRVRVLNNYDYILKLHTKKSKHRDDGGEWFMDLLEQLIPSDTSSIQDILSKGSTGAIGPEGHIVSLSRHMGSNRQNISSIVKEMTDKSYDQIIKDEEKYPFIGSTMFWCRVDYLEPILDMFLTPSDFERENGQVDGTVAHAVERVLGVTLHSITKRRMYTVNNKGVLISVDKTTSYTEKYRFAE